MLYIVSTPIGNLKDITLRAIEVLNLCDLVLCEDTRTSKFLLDKFEIKTSLQSYHKFNEKSKLQKIVALLKSNKNIALVSDAGTPLISDPGLDLYQECLKEGIEVTHIPGASSIINALVLSGFDTKTFQFLGFLPKKQNELLFIIKKMLFYDGTSIFFESPNRIEDTIKVISKIDPLRNVCILKEMTKKFEKRIVFPAEKMVGFLKDNPIKGEIVCLLEKGEIPQDLSDEELVLLLKENFSLSLKESILMAKKLKKVSRKDLYKKFFNN